MQVEALPSKMAEYFVQIAVGCGEKTGQTVATFGTVSTGIIIALARCPYYALAMMCYLPIAYFGANFFTGNIRSSV